MEWTINFYGIPIPFPLLLHWFVQSVQWTTHSKSTLLVGPVEVRASQLYPVYNHVD